MMKRVLLYAAVCACARPVLTLAANIGLSDRRDILIHSSADTAISVEPSIAAHPDDWKTLLVGVIKRAVGGDEGCAGWFSTDGGVTWVGDNEPAHSPGRGDPFVAIRRGSPTRYFILSIGDTLSAAAPFYAGGQRIVWTDSATSTNWPGQGLAAKGVPKHPQKTDKGCLHVDNDSTSSFAGRAYAAWFDVEGGARLSYSTNGGASWQPDPPVELRATGETWGVAIATAINGSGNAYTAWPQGSGGAPGSILFRMSADGGGFVRGSGYSGKPRRQRH